MFVSPRFVRPLLLSLGGLPAAGALADPPPAATLPVVTVTAKGYAAEAARTPASVLAFDADDIAASGSAQLGDLLRGQPGLSVARDGLAGQSPVLRGLKRESVVLLVDGMRLNSAQPAGAVASMMSFGLAERVEVVKGPASVLYGTGALGGVVNVQLPQARFEPGLSFRAGLGASCADRGLRAAGVLNAASESQALMLGWAPVRVDDYRAPAGTVAESGYDGDSLIGQYRWRLSQAQQLRVSAQWHEDRDLWFNGSARPGTPAVLGTVTVRSPLQRRTLAEAGYTLQLDGDASVADLRLYRQSVRRQIRAFSSALQRDTSETDVSFDTTGVDGRITHTLAPDHVLSAGINSWRTAASPERFITGNPPLFNLRNRNDPFDDGRLDALGVFVQDDLGFGRSNLVAGLRYDRVEGRAASVNNGAVTRNLARRDTAFSANLGLLHELSPRLRPYVNLARGFRAGDLRERFESSPRGDGHFYLGNPQIRPEIATQLELGVKGADATMDYALALYRARIDDYITGRLTGAEMAGLPVKQTENIGRVTLDGAEGKLRWQLRKAQWLQAGFSLLRATNDDLDEPLFQSPADELFVGWEGRVAAGWIADARWRLVARQDRVATRFARGTENPTAGFATADLGLTWQRGAHRYRLAVTNLLDKAYHEHLDDGASGREPRAPGRSLSLSWQGSF